MLTAQDNEIYERAVVVAREGSVAEAIALLTPVADANPECAELQHDLGGLLHRMGRIPQAARHLARAAEAAPTNPEILRNLSEVAQKMGLTAEADAIRERLRELERTGGSPSGRSAERIRCAAPWYELQLEYSGRVACCCYYTGPVDTWNGTDPFDLEAMWNGRRMRAIRRGILAGDARVATGCGACSMFQFSESSAFYPPEFLNIPSELNRLQRENWEMAVEDFRAGRDRVSAHPMRLYFNFGLACNIKCIMCGQTDLRRVDKRRISSQLLQRAKPFLRTAHRIGVIGGEVLMMPESLRFIDEIVSDPTLDNVWLDVFTNATLLHKHLDRLAGHKKVNVCVSLDSVGETYEYIRAGAQWSQVERNVLAFQEMGRTGGRNWVANTANIVMKSSLKKLTELVRWHVRHGICPNFIDFSPVASCTEVFQRENIFKRPELLAEVPGWQDIFHESAELLAGAGWNGAATLLRSMKSQLEVARAA